jgi:putative acetyltransferase
VIIPRETLEDRAAVDAVTSAAFGRPWVDGEPVETRLLRALRDDAGWISTLSMVAERDHQIIGHVVCTRGRVGVLDALGLGPISVLPSRQRQGAGAALMHAVIGAADAARESLIALLGDPRFYIRFGFVPASSLGSKLLILPGLSTSRYGLDELPARGRRRVSIRSAIRRRLTAAGRARRSVCAPVPRSTNRSRRASARRRSGFRFGLADTGSGSVATRPVSATKQEL